MFANCFKSLTWGVSAGKCWSLERNILHACEPEMSLVSTRPVHACWMTSDLVFICVIMKRVFLVPWYTRRRKCNLQVLRGAGYSQYSPTKAVYFVGLASKPLNVRVARFKPLSVYCLLILHASLSLLDQHHFVTHFCVLVRLCSSVICDAPCAT